MPNSTRPPPRDPLAETWPEDAAGVPVTEKQAEYLLGVIDRLEKHIAEHTLSEDDLAYLKRKRQEDEHFAYLWQMVKRHAPWVATVCAFLSWAVTYVLTHNFHVSNK